MKQDEISTRQWLVIALTALLMPVIELLPTMTARAAGSAGWLSVLGAAPVLLAAGWAANGIRRGKAKLPHITIILYMGWTLVLLMINLRLGAARLEQIYGKTTAAISAVVVLVIAVRMAMGKLSSFARAGEIFYLALAVLLAGVLLLALLEVEPDNLATKSEDWPALPRSSLSAAGVLLNVYPAVALTSRIKAQPQSGRQKAAWVVAFCGVATLVLGAVAGCLGPKLTGKLTSPFQIMIQGLGVHGVFQRAEAFVVSVLTLSDLMLMGVLLCSWRALASCIHKGDWSRKSLVPAAMVAAIGGWVLFFDTERLWEFYSEVLPIIGVFLGFVLPIVVRCMMFMRKKKKRD